MAVLDPAPRSATIVAKPGGVRVLRLGGDAFRGALNTDPSIASGVIRTLAQRLRAAH
jgi:CRP-like cAMP-binding protein